jgi:Ca2+:H+ antiporter
MSIDTSHLLRVPRWTWGIPLVALVLAFVKLAGGPLAGHPVFLLTCAALLLATVFAAVHHSEVLALRLGEPLGSLVLALSVTIIEVSLIVSLMMSADAGADTLARDTVYATVMIVLGGIVGGCLLLGGVQHHEQTFRLESATAALSVLATMAITSLILPRLTSTTAGPTFAPVQLLAVGLVSLTLYGTFLFVQTTRHRDYFLDPVDVAPAVVPVAQVGVASSVLLIVSLVGVVLLAKGLSPSIGRTVAALGLPAGFVGVVVAVIVLLPESVAALGAARRNRLQVSLNLALGSALATVGLTVPIVGAVSLYAGLPMVLGLPSGDVALLLLALNISSITLATGRTTILQGVVHLGVFVVFLVLQAMP